MTPPNPASAAAVAQGCTCPADKNASGAGCQQEDGTRTWYIKLYCPVHSSFKKLPD